MLRAQPAGRADASVRAFRDVALVMFLVIILPASAAAQADESSPRRTPVIADAALLGASTAHAITAALRWGEAELRAGGRVLVLLAALSSLDESGRSFMRVQHSARWDDIAIEIERLGTVQNFSVLGGFFAAGLLLDDRKARAVAVEGVASSLVAGALITPTLQAILGRSRPRRNRDAYSFDAFSGNISLPSGHTTHAFAVASVIATEYDHIAVQLLAYGLATGVAAARMYHDAHFVSDVAAAAVIGTVVGRSVARYGQARRNRLQVVPIPGAAGGLGLQVTVPSR